MLSAVLLQNHLDHVPLFATITYELINIREQNQLFCWLTEQVTAVGTCITNLFRMTDRAALSGQVCVRALKQITWRD